MTDETTHLVRRLAVLILFSIAFSYVHTAAAIYREAAFRSVPALTEESGRLMITELGGMVATLVLIVTAAWLFGASRQERMACFLLVLTGSKIFYYIWILFTR